MQVKTTKKKAIAQKMRVLKPERAAKTLGVAPP
jgi:hypothetical protein